MAISDDDETAERLAQTRAARRQVSRLRTAERRDAGHEHAAERRAEAEAGYDSLSTPALPSAETRALLAAEQDEFALERGNLGADRDVDDGIDMDM